MCIEAMLHLDLYARPLLVTCKNLVMLFYFVCFPSCSQHIIIPSIIVYLLGNLMYTLISLC